jgi:hypothetical protein
MIRKRVFILMLCVLWLIPSVVSAGGDIGGVGYGFTPERLKALGSGIIGLISIIIGGLSLARSNGRFGSGSGRRGAVVSAALGLVCIVLAGLHLAGTSGGFGTGSGRAGAIVAIAAGLIGIVLAGITLIRSSKGRTSL